MGTILGGGGSLGALAGVDAELLLVDRPSGTDGVAGRLHCDVNSLGTGDTSVLGAILDGGGSLGALGGDLSMITSPYRVSLFTVLYKSGGSCCARARNGASAFIILQKRMRVWTQHPLRRA